MDEDYPIEEIVFVVGAGMAVAAGDRAAIAGDRAAATAWVLARRVIYPRLFSHKRADVKLSLG
jgi:hypothetical protein